jgi:hypothetical protein
LESTRSKYLASEQKITELKIALQAAELNSEAKVNHDERQKEELLQLRKLNRKLDREISMYKVHTVNSCFWERQIFTFSYQYSYLPVCLYLGNTDNNVVNRSEKHRATCRAAKKHQRIDRTKIRRRSRIAKVYF